MLKVSVISPEKILFEGEAASVWRWRHIGRVCFDQQPLEREISTDLSLVLLPFV